MDMTFRRTQVGSRHVLVLAGDVDLTTLPRFNDALSRLITDGAGDTLVVDLDGAGLIEDAGLGLLLGAAGRARATGGDLVVVCTEPRLRQRLADTGFDRAITVSASIAS
jgi:anti-sigma B factor antagonist